MDRAERNIQWIEEHIIIPDGKFAGQPLRLSKFQKKVIRKIYGKQKIRRAIVTFGRKNAKALDLDTPIPTPDGWLTIADIQPGDYVYGSNGTPIEVLAVSEVFTDKPCSDVEFSDGSVIRCSDDHLWTTRHRYRPWAKTRVNGSGNGGRPRVDTITTAQLRDSVYVQRTDGGREHNHKLTTSPAVESGDIELPVDPYVLGYWLGDGTSKSATITCSEADVDHVCESVAVAGNVLVRRHNERAPTVAIRGGLQAQLRLLGLLKNKHIPDIFFDAGTEQRRRLLQGLMDSDGTVNRHAGKTTSRCSFTNMSESLAYGVWRLARSLGLKATIRQGDAKLDGRVCGTYHEASFAASRSDRVFSLARKQELLPEVLGKRSKTLTITGVAPAPTVPTKCLMVDAEDSQFLVGHGCIPTHNTTLAGILMLLHLCGPEYRHNSELYSSALSRDQAAILFSLAAKMVRLSPTLREVVMIRDTVKQLYCSELGTKYSALSADASTNLGLSPVFIVHDELGQVKGPRHSLYEALETATAAQENPLSIIISTQAPNDADLLSVLIDDALQENDPRVALFLYTADIEADPFDVETIRQANPAFDEFMNQEEVLAMAADAERMPSREAEYRNLILNQRVEASNPFVTRSVWEANAGENDGWGVAYGGLDLSQTNDLTALVLVSEVDGIYNSECTFWLPGEGIEERARADRVPYDVWAKQGFLKLSPGRSVEYQYVANYLVEIFDRKRIRKLAFDRWNMRHLRPWLVQAGMSEAFIDERFEDFGQGYVSMSPALRNLESILLNVKLRHGGHPVMQMCAANAVVKMDEAGNRKLDKKNSRGRIDGMVALAMACEVASSDGQQQPVFADTFGSRLEVESFVEDLG